MIKPLYIKSEKFMVGDIIFPSSTTKAYKIKKILKEDLIVTEYNHFPESIAELIISKEWFGYSHFSVAREMKDV